MQVFPQKIRILKRHYHTIKGIIKIKTRTNHDTSIKQQATSTT
jgi:hypothetical protein